MSEFDSTDISIDAALLERLPMSTDHKTIAGLDPCPRTCILTCIETCPRTQVIDEPTLP